MQSKELITKLMATPETVTFEETMQVINSSYRFTPTAFDNGSLHNDKGSNEGSCKIFAFAKLQNLTDQQTLACFGDYYHKDVLQNPDGKDHGNIRQFMKTGLSGIAFPNNNPLIPVKP